MTGASAWRSNLKSNYTAPVASATTRYREVVAKVTCVHGVDKQLLGEQSLLQDWLPRSPDGPTRAGSCHQIGPNHVAMASYGDICRSAGDLLAVGAPDYTAADVESGHEENLLFAWWRAAAEIDAAVAPPPDADNLARAPGSAQTALWQLSRSKFFANIALHHGV